MVAYGQQAGVKNIYVMLIFKIEMLIIANTTQLNSPELILIGSKILYLSFHWKYRIFYIMSFKKNSYIWIEDEVKVSYLKADLQIMLTWCFILLHI